MAEHTKGPWVVWSEENSARTRWSVCRHVGDILADNEDYLCVATVKGANESEAHANARLIAAAPDLLAALKRALAHVTHEETTTASEATKDAMRGIANGLRDAIAKAELPYQQEAV